jgi:hypothetical protein
MSKIVLTGRRVSSARQQLSFGAENENLEETLVCLGK